MVEKRELLHRGKVKAIFATEDPKVCIAEFSDSITAGDGAKWAELPGKGKLLNQISCLLFSKLAEAGIESHFIRDINDNSMLVHRAKLFPLEVVVRNITAGNLCRRLGVEMGKKIQPPLVEFFWKNDELHDPLLTPEHIRFLELASAGEAKEMIGQALAVNTELIKIFDQAGLDLVDFKLEFGSLGDKVILIDEISPDTCRLWLKGTTISLDKDRFRNETGDVLEAYNEVLTRLKEAKQ